MTTDREEEMDKHPNMVNGPKMQVDITYGSTGNKVGRTYKRRGDMVVCIEAPDHKWPVSSLLNPIFFPIQTDKTHPATMNPYRVDSWSYAGVWRMDNRFPSLQKAIARARHITGTFRLRTRVVRAGKVVYHKTYEPILSAKGKGKTNGRQRQDR